MPPVEIAIFGMSPSVLFFGRRRSHVRLGRSYHVECVSKHVHGGIRLHLRALPVDDCPQTVFVLEARRTEAGPRKSGSGEVCLRALLLHRFTSRRVLPD